MIIQIDNDLRIRTDPHNWIVEKRYDATERSEERWAPMTFHGNPIYALKSACSDEIKALPNTRTMQQLIKEVNALFKKYEGIIELLPQQGKPQTLKMKRKKLIKRKDKK